ncbi:cation:proton antiporter [archaeon]|nr:cation:proton antiporter [archaeon]
MAEVLSPEALAFLVAGGIIVLGFLGAWFSRRTRIPDVIFMMLFGVLLGPVTHLINPETLMPIAPYFATLALIIILFDGGLNLNVQEALRRAPRALALAIIGFLLSTAGIAVFCKYVLGWRWALSLILGSMLGGSSSIVILGITKEIHLPERIRILVSLESMLTDILCVVGVFMVLDTVFAQEVHARTAQEILQILVGRATISLLLGLAIGVLWILALQGPLHDKPYSYMMTLAVAFLLYAITEALGGFGGAAIVLLGLVLGNGAYFLRWIGRSTRYGLGEEMKKFHDEISFLIRSYFYVFMGLILSADCIMWPLHVGGIPVPCVLITLVIAVIIMGARFVTVEVALLQAKGRPFRIWQRPLAERMFVFSMMPRGLAAIVLAVIISSELGIQYQQALLFPTIASLIVVFTSLVATLGVGAYAPKLPYVVESGKPDTYHTVESFTHYRGYR